MSSLPAGQADMEGAERGRPRRAVAPRRAVHVAGTGVNGTGPAGEPDASRRVGTGAHHDRHVMSDLLTLAPLHSAAHAATAKPVGAIELGIIPTRRLLLMRTSVPHVKLTRHSVRRVGCVYKYQCIMLTPMDTTEVPKPGPLLAQTARRHALEADRLLTTLDLDAPVWKAECVTSLAQAHALTSLALTQLNPPPRRFRPRPNGKAATA